MAFKPYFLFNLLALVLKAEIDKFGLSSIYKDKSPKVWLDLTIFWKSLEFNCPLRIFSDEIEESSASILVASCSDDISKEKKPTTFFLFLSSIDFVFTILKAMLVAKAVLPIEGLPASINKSVLWKPPSNWSKSVNPVAIPESWPSLLYADSALLIASTKDVENFLKSWFISLSLIVTEALSVFHSFVSLSLNFSCQAMTL